MANAPSKKLGLRARAALGDQSLVLVGLMGAGKSAIGKIVASAMKLPFIDTDEEIETVSRMTINDLFSNYGEAEFRALETRVIERIVSEGPSVISTGGGAFMNDETRAAIEGSDAVTLWLKADLETLWQRVSRRDTRPLLRTENPKQVLKDLMDARYPIYALADIEVTSRDMRKEMMAEEVLRAIIDAFSDKKQDQETHAN